LHVRHRLFVKHIGASLRHHTPSAFLTWFLHRAAVGGQPPEPHLAPSRRWRGAVPGREPGRVGGDRRRPRRTRISDLRLVRLGHWDSHRQDTRRTRQPAEWKTVHRTTVPPVPGPPVRDAYRGDLLRGPVARRWRTRPCTGLTA